MGQSERSGALGRVLIPPDPVDVTEFDQVRCGCGSLLARRTGQTIELKCRRCRRHLFLRLLADGGVEVHDHLPAPVP